MTWHNLLRLLVMLLAFGAYAGGAAAIQPGAGHGTSIVRQSDDNGDDEGDDDGGDAGDDGGTDTQEGEGE